MAKFNTLMGAEVYKALRAQSKSYDVELTTSMAYPTGFLPLDYLNGQSVTVYNEDDEAQYKYHSIGLPGGSMITIIGNTSVGKSTAMIQMICAILAQYSAGITPYDIKIEPWCSHEDVEKAGNLNRVLNTTNMGPNWMKKHYKVFQNCSTQEIVDRFIAHCKMKTENVDLWTYDTGLKDIYGDSIKELIPTITAIDSIAVMTSKDINLNDGLTDATNNMAGARNAKFNNGIFKQMIQYAKEANVILFVINHITQKVSTGTPTPAQVMYLGQSESLPGGTASLYLANNLLKLKAFKKLKEEEEYGLRGFVTLFTFLKSRTNAAGVDCELIYDPANGYLKVLSTFHFAFKNGLTKGSPASMYFECLPDVKFTRKNFLTKAKENPMLLEALYDSCIPKLEEYISEGKYFSSEDDEANAHAFINALNSINADF
jgi:hypothetical protein